MQLLDKILLIIVRFILEVNLFTKAQDKGLTWEVISPDLTTNDPEKQKQSESGGLTLDATGAENHCTLTGY